MKRSIAIHAVLLVVAATAAFLVWTRDPSKSDEERTTPVLNLRSVDHVIWDSADRTVHVTMKRDADGKYPWVRVASVVKKPKTPKKKPQQPQPKTAADAGISAGASQDAAVPSATDAGSTAQSSDAKTMMAESEKSEKEQSQSPEQLKSDVKEFMGNAAVAELFNELSRLPAMRALGRLSTDKLAEFGLADAKTKLTIVSGANKRVFSVGEQTYGNLDYYIQDDADQRAYVVDQKLLEQLKHAEYRLFNADLHSFALTDVDRITIASEKTEITLIQHNRRTPAKAFWAKADSTTPTPNETYRNWIQKLSQLKAVKYSHNETVQNAHEVATVTYYAGNKKLGYARLLEHPIRATSPATKAATASAHLVVTEYTRVPVEAYKTRMNAIVNGLPDVLKE